MYTVWTKRPACLSVRKLSAVASSTWLSGLSLSAWPNPRCRLWPCKVVAMLIGCDWTLTYSIPVLLVNQVALAINSASCHLICKVIYRGTCFLESRNRKSETGKRSDWKGHHSRIFFYQQLLPDICKPDFLIFYFWIFQSLFNLSKLWLQCERQYNIFLDKTKKERKLDGLPSSKTAHTFTYFHCKRLRLVCELNFQLQQLPEKSPTV